MSSSGVRVEQLDMATSRGALSALRARPAQETRGVLLALHGGGSRAAYWDSPADAAGSLLRRGAERGWTVLAPDRPGYGASVAWAPAGLPASDQAELIAELIAPPAMADVPVLVVAHSLGTLVALELAARDLVPGMRGLCLGGVPIVFTADQRAVLAAVDTTGDRVRSVEGDVLRDPADWFGPPGTWNPALLAMRDRLVTSTPTREFADLLPFTANPGRLLCRIRHPVHGAAGEHDMTTHDAHTVLGKLAAELVSAPTVELVVVPGSGHNLSLSGPNACYHDAVLDFADRMTASNPPVGAGEAIT